MKRNLVQIARLRMEEVVPGDVVNRNPDDNRGWFVAAVVETLFDGSLQISDATRTMSFSARPLDVIGVQLLKPIELEVTEKVGRVVDVVGQSLDDLPDEVEPDEADADALVADAHQADDKPVSAPADVVRPVAGREPKPVTRPEEPAADGAEEAAAPHRRTVRSLFEG